MGCSGGDGGRLPLTLGEVLVRFICFSVAMVIMLPTMPMRTTIGSNVPTRRVSPWEKGAVIILVTPHEHSTKGYIHTTFLCRGRITTTPIVYLESENVRRFQGKPSFKGFLGVLVTMGTHDGDGGVILDTSEGITLLKCFI